MLTKGQTKNLDFISFGHTSQKLTVKMVLNHKAFTVERLKSADEYSKLISDKATARPCLTKGTETRMK